MTLAVIGAGFGRTGTFSLKLALEQLGFGPCCHGSDQHHFAQGADFWSRISAGESIDWDSFFEGYRSTVDSPSCRFYLELAQKYPAAKVILTWRESNDWFDSYDKTVLPLVRSSNAAEYRSFLFGGDVYDRASIIAAYERHNAEVQRSIPPERLLVYRVKCGWRPLCNFLGVSTPEAPFPYINRRREFASVVDGMLTRLSAD